MRGRMRRLPRGEVVRLQLRRQLLLGLADVGDVERGALRAAHLDGIPARRGGELEGAGGTETGVLALGDGLALRERSDGARARPLALGRLGNRRELVASDQVVPGVVRTGLDFECAVDERSAHAALNVKDVGVLRQRNVELHGALVSRLGARVVDAEVISVGRFLQHRIEGFLACHLVGFLAADRHDRLLQFRRLRRPAEFVRDRLLEPDDLALAELAHLAVLEAERGEFFVLRRQSLHDCTAARLDKGEQLLREGVGEDLVLRHEDDVVAPKRLAVEEVVDDDVEVVVADPTESLAASILLRVVGEWRAGLASQDVVAKGRRVAQHGEVLDRPHF